MLAIILLVATFLLNIVDYVQTMYAIQQLGIGVEFNPLGRFLLENDLAWAAKFVLVPIVLTIMGIVIHKDKKAAWSAYFLFVFYICLVLHNFMMLARAGLI